MKLDELKELLRQDLKFDPNAPPPKTEIERFHANQRFAKGWIGEEGAARRVDARGEIILDTGMGIHDTNKGGPDLVTLAEDENGELRVKFYDNKAFKSDHNVSRVSSLDRTFEDSRRKYVEEWGRLSRDPGRSPAEQKLFGEAARLAEIQRYDRVVTTWAGFPKDITAALKAKGIRYEHLAPPPRAQSPFSRDAKLEPPARPAADLGPGTGPPLGPRQR